MCEYSFYKKVSDRPYFLFTINSGSMNKSWLIPGIDRFEKDHERIAIEVDNEDINVSNIQLIEKGDFVFEMNKSNKLKIRILKSKYLSGSYIFVSRSWGRWTKKKVWVLIPL